jgi:uncharacterized protein involved in exopolysaccharide biosynthesis
MTNYGTAYAAPGTGDPLTIGRLLALVRRHWLVLLGTTLGAATLAALIAFWLTPVYRAEIVLVPNESSPAGGLQQLVGRIGSLGSLAGLTLGAGSGMRVESVAILRSRALAEEFIRQRDLMPTLYADDWDAESRRWTADPAPTLRGGVDDFVEDVRSVVEDRRSGLVTLSIEWTDPDMAADWANAYVAAANEVARRRAIEEATHMLKFLHEELGKTSVLGVQQGIYQLVETQINTIALANVRQEYAFRVVDPATAPDPDRPVRPIRPLIVALGAALGFGAMLLVLLLRTGPGRPEERPDGA